MKQFVGAVLAVALMAGLGMAAENKVELKSTKDKVSYAIGARIAQDLSRQKLDLTPEMVAAGLKDAMAGGKMLLTEEESRTVLMDFQKELMAAREAEMKAVGEKNAKEGKAFLAANAKKKGVVTLPSGLQYKIITKGKGNSPGKDDTVTVNYRGTLIDGKEFDSSYKRGKPATFR
ncbi:FKBP-type peptidyl-prolyl cis-trans isomerase N-terminal domain-containing protein [Desulfosarcina cetonica]|uniref:FKBP-type peptidyl-prolyl cis-trans isomerase N-terminal domain-containing protein n=1 Tax=Desulfosarcina cetonica TaxID=90730 RepID=UPI000A868C2F|nr:FKBP-type peptidyl-prolyl cis-trans isomerase N-terminal domain-containing protein [Desulfosarcina cetonica]